MHIETRKKELLLAFEKVERAGAETVAIRAEWEGVTLEFDRKNGKAGKPIPVDAEVFRRGRVEIYTDEILEWLRYQYRESKIPMQFDGTYLTCGGFGKHIKTKSPA